MKKTLLALAALIVLFVIVSSVLPSPAIVSGHALSPLPDQVASKGLRNESDWKKWWPGSTGDGKHLVYDGVTFEVRRVELNNILLSVNNKNRVWEGFIGVRSSGKDSSAVVYDMALQTPVKFPFGKVSAYFAAKELKRQMKEITMRLDSFLSHPDNIYGIDIVFGNIRDSSYVSEKFSGDHEPSTAEIYSAIERIKSYAVLKGRKVTGDPMLNVVQTGNHQFESMVALPINGNIEGRGAIAPKKMVMGNVIETEVTGGPSRVAAAQQALEDFANDFRRTSPAIPFQTLLTDRRTTTDSSKWRTRVSLPIF